MTQKPEVPYRRGLLILDHTNDNHVVVAKVTSIDQDNLGLMYWWGDRKWASIFGALAIPFTGSLKAELEDLEEDVDLATNPDFIKAMRKI